MRWGPHVRFAHAVEMFYFGSPASIFGTKLAQHQIFPMLGTKTKLLWGNLSIFDTKTQIFPQFWPKYWNKNYYFFQIGQFLALYSIVFTIFGSQNPFCWKNWSIFHPYTQFSPNYWPSSAPACPFFFLKINQFLAFILNFFNNFWPKKSFFFLL